MSTHTTVTRTFPSVRMPSTTGGLPVEVSLIAQLGHGAGDRLFAEAQMRQQAHADFVDALDEPSARLGRMDLPKGDASSLYSFAVGRQGHPFHRHAGHRVFTAISGSGGAQLRFSSATQAQIDEDPSSFIRALRHINIPPDSLFTVRFGGDTWHQFAPLARHSLHPVFFALSCHTNELGGDLPEPLRERVQANEADIPALTVLAPAKVTGLLRVAIADGLQIPTIQLALDAPPGTLHGMLCRSVRCVAGLLRGAHAAWRHSAGFLTDFRSRRAVVALKQLRPGSLLERHLAGAGKLHEDVFCLTLADGEAGSAGASILLSRLLEGFVNNPPASVSRMMSWRNLLVKPIGLRTSPLGCPVSSLLSPQTDNLFDDRYPVLDQRVDEADRRAQVILGADDRHLVFRSSVEVRRINANRMELILATRVHCRNLFGRIYLALIDRTQRSHVAPIMLRMAAEHAFPSAPADRRLDSANFA